MSGASTGMRRWIGRALLALFGVAVAIVAVEAALQVGSLALWATGRSLPTSWIGARRRILCVGDSNTYGLYLRDRADAYPSQLERLWNATPDLAPVEVMNLGYPGTNSSRLVRDLPSMLDALRPDVVMLMVGSNDFWTAPVRAPTQDSGLGKRIGLAIERYSRVYHLVHMIGRAFDQRRLEVNYPLRVNGGSAGSARFGDFEIPLGWEIGRPRGADAYEELERNLGTLADIVRAHRAEPVFVTYGSAMWNYGDASRTMRRAAADRNLRIVDAAPAIAAMCPEEPCPQWLYKDHHPTANGYRLIAEEIVRQFGGAPAPPSPSAASAPPR